MGKYVYVIHRNGQYFKQKYVSIVLWVKDVEHAYKFKSAMHAQEIMLEHGIRGRVKRVRPVTTEI